MPITPGAGIHPDLMDEVDEITIPSGSATHPDLVDSGGAADSATDRSETDRPSPVEGAPRERATGAEPTDGEGARNTPETTSGEAPAATGPETPSWQDQVREAKDPAEALAVLTANLPKEQLARDRVLAGLIGDLGQRRAREMLAEAQEQQRQQQATEAAQKGDYYALGEAVAPEVLQRIRDSAATQAFAPFMQGVEMFQRSLPDEVQREVGGRSWPGATPAEQVANYLNAVAQSAVKHGLTPEVEREIKRRESSIRKQVLTDAYGSDQSPELAGGTAHAQREITSEQVEAMSIAEYEQYFDQYGNPKEGVKYIVTRGEQLRSR